MTGGIEAPTQRHRDAIVNATHVHPQQSIPHTAKSMVMSQTPHVREYINPFTT